MTVEATNKTKDGERHKSDAGVYAYHLLRVAVEGFGKQPGELSTEQAQAAQRQADQTFAMEGAALASREGARVTIPDVAVNAALDQIKARYEDPQGFEAAMRENAMTERDLKRALWRELAFDAVMSLVGEGAEPVTDADVAAFYSENPERFQKPELRTARHILITINPDDPDNTPEAAHRRIGELLVMANADPSKFAELATRNSECPTALDGGSLGQVPPGKLFDSLDAILFKLDVGEVGGPVETEAGLHIIFCEAVDPGGEVTLEQARDKIRTYLTQTRQKARQKAWLKERMDAGAAPDA